MFKLIWFIFGFILTLLIVEALIEIDKKSIKIDKVLIKQSEEKCVLGIFDTLFGKTCQNATEKNDSKQV